jgi:hypothetical protein
MRGRIRRGLDATLSWYSGGRKEDARSESPAPVMRLAIEAIQVSCGWYMVKWGLDGRARRWVSRITVASLGLMDCVWIELY